MNGIVAVARKELRAFFQSPVAVIFLGVFLFVTVGSFFGYYKFFARNLADVRPLFQSLPMLLIFLVSAITMRQWAEERRTGTLEILMTLPIRASDLVIGKFVAGLVLVALALALTLPLPITVSQLGDLDWGPVWGGYVAALLLASTYLAIGLCVSARTDNQVVALMVTLVIGGLLYLVGTDRVTSMASQSTADVLRAIGTGSRFENVERGVIDLRDLAYYLGLTAFFLALNTYFVERPRLDAGSERGRQRNLAAVATVALVGLNVVALSAWLAPVTALRVDLTERGEYSVSAVTKETLASLDEPLLIDGFFSEQTHPLLTPLVPQIRDLLSEYAVHGGGRVQVRTVDPNTDEELEQEIQEQYGIRSIPFRVEDRHERSVVNSYFQILVRYGDQYEVLGIDQLVEVSASDDGLDVKLRSLEYDLTRAIRKVSRDFTTTEALLAKLPEAARVTAYLSPGTLPEDWNELPARLRSAMGDFERIAGDKLTFEEIDPSTTPGLPDRLAKDYGIQPFAQDLFARQVFWAHIVIQIGDKVERMMPDGTASEADLKKAFEAAFKRATPGQLKTIGVYTETPEAPPPDPQLPPQMQPPPPQADFQVLARQLGQDFTVEPVDLTGGAVPDNLDVLVVGKVGVLDDKARFAIDQYLMRGGSVVALASGWKFAPDRQGLKVVANPTDLADLLATYGVTVGKGLLMDAQNAPFPVPVQERRGPFTFERIELVPYPFFPDVRPEGFAEDHPIVAGLQNVTLPWGSPLTVSVPEAAEGETPPITAVELLRTSDKTWINESGDINPDFQKYPDAGFAAPAATESRIGAVALTGTFPSWFVKHPLGDAGDWADRALESSLPGARLVVVGSSEAVSDLMLGFSQQMGGEPHRSNLQLVANAIDWSVEDLALLQIRSTGSFARTIRPLEDAERTNWEYGNYAFVLMALGVIVVLPKRRKKFDIRQPSAAAIGGPAAQGGV